MVVTDITDPVNIKGIEHHQSKLELNVIYYGGCLCFLGIVAGVICVLGRAFYVRMRKVNIVGS
jgi:hypothetical protein